MIEVNIPSGVTRVKTNPLYQWDYGQKLRVTGVDIHACFVHFCDRTCTETIVRVASEVEGGIETTIPDKLLENQYDINAFVYVVGEGTGKTKIHIEIPVIERKKPEDHEDPIPESVQTQLEEMITNANNTVALVEEKVVELETEYNEKVNEYDNLVQEKSAEVDTLIAEIDTKVETEVEKQIDATTESIKEINRVLAEDVRLKNATSKITFTENNLIYRENYIGEVYSVNISSKLGNEGYNGTVGVMLRFTVHDNNTGEVRHGLGVTCFWEGAITSEETANYVYGYAHALLPGNGMEYGNNVAGLLLFQVKLDELGNLSFNSVWSSNINGASFTCNEIYLTSVVILR